MKVQILSIFVIAILSAASVSALASPQFFSALQDIPLMPGMTELSEEGYVFDKPQGRIGESLAYGSGMSLADIREYYRESLPQFGWSRLSETVYVRNDEEIHLQFERSDQQNFLKISIRPRF